MLKNILRPPVKLIRKYKARSALTKLREHESPRIRAIGEALHETLNNILSDEEQRRIAAIEQRRTFLLGSDEEIAVIDYGAGSSDSHRTREEMDNGVPSTARVSNVCKASKPAFWATSLFKLVRKLEPASCLELGSCVGISAAYQATALNINGKGKLVTLEGSPEIARIARETFDTVGLHNASVVIGPFHKTLAHAFESAKPVDFFFNDGHHDHDAVIRYFNEAIPYLSDNAVIVFDDISWSPGMRKAWTEIEEDKRVSASIDLQTTGIVLMGGRLSAKENFRIPL